jgi:hypothetical protein
MHVKHGHPQYSVSSSVRCRNKARTAGIAFTGSATPSGSLNIGSTTTGVAVNKFNEELPLVRVKTQAQRQVPAAFGDCACTVELARIVETSVVCDSKADLGKCLAGYLRLHSLCAFCDSYPGASTQLHWWGQTTYISCQVAAEYICNCCLQSACQLCTWELCAVVHADVQHSLVSHARFKKFLGIYHPPLPSLSVFPLFRRPPSQSVCAIHTKLFCWRAECYSGSNATAMQYQSRVTH